MTASEFLRDKTKINPKEWGPSDNIISAMKEYAKQKCEEQRHECQIEHNKRSIFGNGLWFVACEDVMNADEPKFD